MRFSPHFTEAALSSAESGVNLVSDNDLHHYNPEVSVESPTDPAAIILPTYNVTVKDRVDHREPETNEYGTFRQQKVRYSDGAVRLVTIGEPKNPRSKHPVVSADPWLTGPNGLNKIEIQQLVRNGLFVVWNHHQGRHTPWPTNRDRLSTALHFLSSKSIGKSAAHDHALLDHMAGGVLFDTDATFRKGYSRSAMSGEAYIALGARRENPRETLLSDLEAHCFARGVNIPALASLLLKQAPHEARAMRDMAASLVRREHIDADGRTISLREYVKTIDPHVLNMAHELAWISLFINGEAGLYGKAIPTNSRGIRTIYTHDYMSQQADQVAMHQERPSIVILERPGAHLTGASPEMLYEKSQRWGRVARYALEHDDDLSDLTAAEIV